MLLIINPTDNIHILIWSNIQGEGGGKGTFDQKHISYLYFHRGSQSYS